jgi:membrane protease YdiL (CAAX protease family)
MKKFFVWVLLFFVLLVSIPLLMFSGYFLIAKLIGVMTLVLLSLALRIWMYKTKKEYNPIERVKINLNDRFWLSKHITFYNQLSSIDKIIFEDRVGIFLSRVPIIFSSNQKVTSKEDAMLVASSAICAFWNSSESNIPFKGYILINDVGSLVDSTRLNVDFIEIPLEHLLDRTVLTRFYWA